MPDPPRSSLKRQLAIEYRQLRKPRRVRVHDVKVTIDPAWAQRVIDIIYSDEYENPEAHVLRNSLRADDRYLEIGAGIGVITTAACRIVGDRRVTAFEANPALVEVAARTASENGFSPEIINAVLGEDDAPRQFFVHEQFWASSLLEAPGTQEITVPGRALSAELQRTGATYLMIDIEGGEIDLLARDLPAPVRAICAEMHPVVVGHAQVQELLQRLMAQGFLLDTELSGTRTVFLFREPAARDQPATA